jgi:hypothetical protein
MSAAKPAASAPSSAPPPRRARRSRPPPPPRAASRQRLGDLAADAARAARDQCHLAREIDLLMPAWPVRCSTSAAVPQARSSAPGTIRLTSPRAPPGPSSTHSARVGGEPPHDRGPAHRSRQLPTQQPRGRPRPAPAPASTLAYTGKAGGPGRRLARAPPPARRPPAPSSGEWNAPAHAGASPAWRRPPSRAPSPARRPRPRRRPRPARAL